MDRRYFKTLSLTLLVGVGLCMAAIGAESVPSLAGVQTKVQSDLELALMRMLEPEDFLVQTSVELGTKQEKKLIEDETSITGTETEEDSVVSAKKKPAANEDVIFMPGFTPELEEEVEEQVASNKKAPVKNTHTKQVYRMTEIAEVKSVNVQLGINSGVSSENVQRAQAWVQTYLDANFPGKANLNLSRLTFLKKEPSKKEITAQPNSIKPTDEAVKEKTSEAPLSDQKWIKESLPWWILSGVLFLITSFVLLLFRNVAKSSPQAPPWPLATAPLPGPPGYAWNPAAFAPGFGVPSHQSGPRKKRPREDTSALPPETTPNTIEVETPAYKRKQFLKSIISRADSFRLYHSKLSSELTDELFALLKGPAYEKLLDGLSLKKPTAEPFDPPDAGERLDFHRKNFEEFCQAQDWQERQFFGFIQRLTREQVLTLILHEPVSTVCVLLRFLKPDLSAYILEALPPDKRHQVLAEMPRLSNTSISEILVIEERLRKVIERMPNSFFGSGREEVEYWKNVVNQVTDQDAILGDLERTNPGIFVEVAKNNFKLEQTLTLPEDQLKRVLGETDNQELALALLACPDEIKQHFLSAVPSKRRLLIEDQMDSIRDATKEERTEARIKLTRKFRELLA